MFVAALFLTVCLLLLRVNSYHKSWRKGVLAIVAVVSVAGFTSWMHSYMLNVSHVNGGKLMRASTVFMGSLFDYNCGDKGSCDAIFQVVAVKSDSGWFSCSYPIALRISEGDWLREGDLLLVRGRLNIISPPLNAGEFDFKAYMEAKEVRWQTSVDTGDVLLLSRFHAKGIWVKARQWRAQLAERLNTGLISKSRQSVIKALVFGDKRGLDRALKEHYAGSGVMHILAVSGMHIGTFYALFAGLFGFLRRYGWGRIVFCLLLLLLLWSYSFFTGLSPSVQRACLMYSMMLVGKLLNEQRNVFNLLCGSVIVLLVASPPLLYNVGFLLSYLAVSGILIFYPLFYERWTSSNLLLDKVVQLLAVSVAAQLGTFPVSIYVFHQFPNYFLLSNLFVVPLALLIFYSTLLFLPLSGISVLGSILTRFIDAVVTVLNTVVRIIHQFPYAVTEQIWLSKAEVLLWYGGVLGLFWWLYYRKRLGLLWLGVMLAMLIVLHVEDNWSEKRQCSIHLYAFKGSSVYGFVKGRQEWLLCERNEYRTAAYFRRRLELGWLKRGVREVFWPSWSDLPQSGVVRFGRNTLVNWSGHRIAFLCATPEIGNDPHPIAVHTLVVSDNFPLQNDCFYEVIRFDRLVVDGSNSRRHAASWCEVARSRGIPCYDLRTTGELTIGL